MGANEWELIIDFAWLSVLLGFSTFLKRKIPFLKKYIVPNAIIAGFLGLILGPEILNIIPFDPERLGYLVYHLLAIGFISLALKERKIKLGNNVSKTGIFIVGGYLIQGIVGFTIIIVLFYTIFPDLFPPLGLLLPLGFGQGPGVAFSIGKTWEGVGLKNGGSIGLTLATFGFLWASFGGVISLNYLLKKKKDKIEADQSEKEIKMIDEKDQPGDIPLSESIDRFSVQLFLIGIIYLITYFFLSFISKYLLEMGSFGATLSDTLWGFHFVFGTLFAILLRKVFDICKKKKVMIRNYPNNYLLQRVSGGAFDFMIAGSIAAISINAIKQYWVSILLICFLGGFVTLIYCYKLSKKIYPHYHLEYAFMLFGNLTGTISTGMALLREMDPHFNTPAAESLVFGSGLALFIGFPLLLVINLPVEGFKTNNPLFYLLTFGILLIYFIILMLALRVVNKKSK